MHVPTDRCQLCPDDEAPVVLPVALVPIGILDTVAGVFACPHGHVWGVGYDREALGWTQ